LILYLHGFRSSPQSAKARQLAARLTSLGQAKLWRCPQLPASPREAIDLLRAQYWPNPEDTVIGSSLGGHYARYVAEATGSRAVLLNPAVRPDLSLAQRVGLTTGWHDGRVIDFRRDDLIELAKFGVEQISRPERYLLIAAKGDEVLDWREMVAAFPGAKQLILPGSDHAIADFGPLVDRVLEFAGVIAPIRG